MSDFYHPTSKKFLRADTVAYISMAADGAILIERTNQLPDIVFETKDPDYAEAKAWFARVQDGTIIL